MAGRPAIQFYFGDWKKNKKLRFCGWGARGVWMEVMGLMHGSEEYGVLRQPLKKIAAAIGAPMPLLKELVEQGVLKGADKGPCETYVFQPKHAGQLGDPVILVPVQDGPIWYSSRMVRDEFVRSRRGANTRFKEGPKGGNGESPKGGFGDGFGGAQKGPPNAGQGDGASSSSSTSEIGNTSTSMGTEGDGQPFALAVVDFCKVLRKMGGNASIHPARMELHALASQGFSTGTVALTAAELALKAAGMHGDHDRHPELMELFASGATQQQMLLTDSDYLLLRNSLPNLGYLRSTVEGRARDARTREEQDRRSASTKHSARPNATSPIKGTEYAPTDISQFEPEFRDGIAARLVD